MRASQVGGVGESSLLRQRGRRFLLKQRGKSKVRMQITSQRVRSLYSPAIILAWVWDGPGAFSKWPINFPTFHTLWVASLIQHRPLCHFDFYGACAYLALVPPPNLVPKWGEEFSLSNYLAGFWHQWVPYPLIFPALCALSLRTSPLLPSWPVGRTPQSLDRLSIGNNLRENSNSYSYPNNKLLQRKETFFFILSQGHA